MRFAPLKIALLAACLTPVPVLGVEEDRYGADLSTFDFGAFEKGAAPNQAESYRSATPPANDLRSRPETTTTAPGTAAPRPGTGSPFGGAAASPPSSSPQLPTAPRPRSSTVNVQPPAGDPFGNLPPSPPTSTAPRPSVGAAAASPNPFAEMQRSPATAPPPVTTQPSPKAQAPIAARPTAPAQTFSSSSQPPARQPASTYRDASVLQPSSPSQAFGTNQGFASQGFSSQSPATSVAASQEGARELRTREMLEKMLRRRSESQLAGTPMPLSAVVGNASTREEQSRRVEAYWALTSSVADYYLGLAEMGELARLRQQVSTYSTVLGAAQTKLATRVETSLKAARAAQYRVAQLMGGGAVPLPSDVPFTGPYATRMESVFAGGVPEEARLIASLLPLRLVELQDAADSVARSQGWIDRVANDQTARSDGEGVVMALELLALNRRAFVQIARDYNLQINRYTQLAAPDRVDTGRLVGMLIRTAGTPGALPGESPMVAGFPAGTTSASRDLQYGAPSRR